MAALVEQHPPPTVYQPHQGRPADYLVEALCVEGDPIIVAPMRMLNWYWSRVDHTERAMDPRAQGMFRASIDGQDLEASELAVYVPRHDPWRYSVATATVIFTVKDASQSLHGIKAV